jgi:ATP-dependent helicase/nuclease subunit A
MPGESRIPKPLFRRPRFLELETLNAAEKGTVLHAVMQRIRLDPGLTEAEIQEEVREMTELRLLAPEQAAAVDTAGIAAFFATDIGRRLLFAGSVMREIPFNYALNARELYPELTGPVAEEPVMIQGIIDCLFADAEGLVLLDYKTDALRGRPARECAERYRVQISLYARAVESIWKRKLAGCYLYFFDGTDLVNMDISSQGAE